MSLSLSPLIPITTGKVLEVWSDGKQMFGHVRYEDGDKVR